MKKDKRRTAEKPTQSLKVFKVTFAEWNEKTGEEFSNVDARTVLATNATEAMFEAVKRLSPRDQKRSQVEEVELLVMLD